MIRIGIDLGGTRIEIIALGRTRRGDHGNSKHGG